MSKKNGNGYGKGTFLDTSLFLSKAFMNLGNKGTSPKVSAASVKILIMLLGKRQYTYVKDRNGNKKRIRTDDNQFTLTYKELESHGVSQKIATRGIDELLAKGFISIVDPGGAFEKHKAVYALEEKYLFWDLKSKPVFFIRKRDVRRGYQRSSKTKTTDVNDAHPHRRQRRTPPIEDTDVNDAHPSKPQKAKTKEEMVC